MSLTHALKAIDELMTAVEQLAANVMPGTAMPYRTPTLTPEQREKRDHDARLERLERVNIAPGDCPEPYRMDVAELLSDVLITADWLLDRTDLHMGADHAPASSHMADPRPLLRLLRDRLQHLPEDEQQRVEDEARGYTSRAGMLLGLIMDGQRIEALCFSCGGKSDRYPIGGDVTLRVRTLHDGEPVIVCEGGRCEPESADCGTWWRGKPAWRTHEWDWLSTRLGRVA